MGLKKPNSHYGSGSPRGSCFVMVKTVRGHFILNLNSASVLKLVRISQRRIFPNCCINATFQLAPYSETNSSDSNHPPSVGRAVFIRFGLLVPHAEMQIVGWLPSSPSIHQQSSLFSNASLESQYTMISKVEHRISLKKLFSFDWKALPS